MDSMSFKPRNQRDKKTLGALVAEARKRNMTVTAMLREILEQRYPAVPVKGAK